MPSLVVPNAALLRLIWTASGVPYAVNVLGVNNPTSAAITQSMTNSIGAAIKSGLTSSAQGSSIGTAIALATVGLRDISVANRAEFTDAGAPVAGTGSGNLIPPQVAYCVTLRTALAGRRFRGRVYLTGYIAAANSTTGQATAGVQTAGVAFITAIQSALAASGLALAVVSRPQPTLPIPWPGAVNNVTSIVGRDLVWDTIRKRATPGI